MCRLLEALDLLAADADPGGRCADADGEDGIGKPMGYQLVATEESLDS